MGLYAKIMLTVNTTVEQFITTNVVSVANGIKSQAFLLLSLYILLWGFSHLLNIIQEPLSDSLKRFTKIFFIFGIAFGMAAYNDYIVDTVTNGPEQLASLLSGASSESSLISNLDSIFEKTWNLGSDFWKKGGLLDGPGLVIVALVVYLIACVLSAYSAFLIILSKVAVAILCALGPLFIISTLFDSTKRFFENWVAMLANYSLVLVLVIAVNAFIMSIFQTYLGQITAGKELQIIDIAPIIVLAIISCLILGQVMSIASGLGGGVSIATMGVGRLLASKARLGASASPQKNDVETKDKKERSFLPSWVNRSTVTQTK